MKDDFITRKILKYMFIELMSTLHNSEHSVTEPIKPTELAQTTTSNKIVTIFACTYVASIWLL